MNSIKKGQLCSINGNNYEKQIYNIVKNCYLNDNKFNTQKIKDLGGSKNINDIQCNYLSNNDIGIEIKKFNTPDWMQCVIKYNNETNIWETSNKSKIPIESKELFNKLLNDYLIFNGEIPPFINKKITHEDWLLIKKETNKWDDFYLNIPDDTIKSMYNFKKCQYIQISDYGLYHLGNDICNFDVPEFIINSEIRIRTKIHSRKNKNGYCVLSVMAACKPVNIKLLNKSKYSLDDISKLPQNLIYKI